MDILKKIKFVFQNFCITLFGLHFLFHTYHFTLFVSHFSFHTFSFTLLISNFLCHTVCFTLFVSHLSFHTFRFTLCFVGRVWGECEESVRPQYTLKFGWIFFCLPYPPPPFLTKSLLEMLTPMSIKKHQSPSVLKSCPMLMLILMPMLIQS